MPVLFNLGIYFFTEIWQHKIPLLGTLNSLNFLEVVDGILMAYFRL